MSVDKLKEVVKLMVNSPINSRESMEQFIKQISKTHNIMPAKSVLLKLYRDMCEQKLLEYNPAYEVYLQKKPMRGQSGVMVIAVFTSPRPEFIDGNGQKQTQEFSCKFDCYYCPKEPNQPRSYLLNEPGVHRANMNNFVAFDQFVDRANAY